METKHAYTQGKVNMFKIIRAGFDPRSQGSGQEMATRYRQPRAEVGHGLEVPGVQRVATCPCVCKFVCHPNILLSYFCLGPSVSVLNAPEAAP